MRPASEQTVTVNFETADGTAKAGSDYTETSGTLTFTAGQTTKTLSVSTVNDDAQESDERFTVTLRNPDGATLDDHTGEGTIRDNDGGGGRTPELVDRRRGGARGGHGPVQGDVETGQRADGDGALPDEERDRATIGRNSVCSSKRCEPASAHSVNGLG